MYLYYCILKHYKGLLKKKYAGNSHILILPISPDNYFYLVVIGELLNEENQYATQLITKLPTEVIEDVLKKEKNYFESRFDVIEKISCSPKKISQGEYKIDLLKKGKNILSNIKLTFEPDYSTNNRRLYIIEGKLNFEASEIQNSTVMKMVADKRMSMLGDLSRYNNYKNIGGNK